MNYNKSAHSFVNYLPNQEINYYQLCRSFSSFLSATATPGVKVILISNSKISTVCFNLYINEILQYLLFSLTCFTLTLQFRLLCTADILYLVISSLWLLYGILLYENTTVHLFIPLLMDIWVVSGLGSYRAAVSILCILWVSLYSY